MTMNDEFPDRRPGDVTQSYLAPITGFAHMIDDLSRLAQRYSFLFLTVFVIICVLIAALFIDASVNHQSVLQLHEAERNNSTETEQLKAVIFYENVIVAVLLGFILLLSLFAGRCYILYNAAKRDLRLFIKPFSKLLQEVTVLFDHGDVSKSEKLALQFQIVEGEISLRRGESISNASIFSIALGR
jgi:hypothetical protein